MISKPVKIGYYAIIEDDYDSVNKTKTTHNEIAGFVNQAIEKSDKYRKQEMAKQELLRVELEMKLKDMEQEVVRKDGIIEICREHINGLEKFIELNNS